MTGRGRRPGGRRPDRWTAVLAAIVVAAAGLALFYGSLTPRRFAADEPAHTAYAVVLGEGHLPSVDTPKPEYERGRPDGRPLRSEDYVYVANHPPLFAAVQAVVSRTIQGVGLADDPELAVGRTLNAATVLGAVVALAATGAALTGSRRIGVLAAGLFAATPELWSLSTYGYSDGAAVLATVLVAWAGIRAWQRVDRASLLGLGAAIALAGAVRATSLIAALGVAAIVAGRVWLERAPGPGLPDGTPATRPGAVRVGWTAVWTGLPVVVFGSWWYVRNWIRFGDPVASDVLITRLDRPTRPGGIPARLADVDMWRYMVTDVVASTYSATYGPLQPRLPAAAIWAIGLVALAALVGLVLPRAARPFGAEVPLAGWAVPVVAVAGVVLGIAMHTAGGGSPHPRYLLPALPLAALLVAAGLERLSPRLTELALVGATVATLVVLARADTWMRAYIAMIDGVPLGPDALRTAGLVLVVGGIAGAAAGALAPVLRRRA